MVALLAVASAEAACGQVAATGDVDVLDALTSAALDTADLGPPGIVPRMHGFNASLTTTTQHDAAGGWSSLLTPYIAYRFTRHFSIDAGVPIYLYIPIYQVSGTAAKPVYKLSAHRGLFGDTELSARGNWYTHRVDYSASVSLGMPSGNDSYGVGAGKVTYDFNNHFEHSFRRLTPEIELGEGDTSTLVDPRIRKSYVSVGPMAHFQAGFSVLLPRNLSFDAAMYEQLPLAKDLVYSTTGKGKKKKTTATNVGPAEDNGLMSSLDVPLSPHVSLSTFYIRSIRDQDDLGGFSLTFLMRSQRAER